MLCPCFTVRGEETCSDRRVPNLFSCAQLHVLDPSFCSLAFQLVVTWPSAGKQSSEARNKQMAIWGWKLLVSVAVLVQPLGFVARCTADDEGRERSALRVQRSEWCCLHDCIRRVGDKARPEVAPAPPSPTCPCGWLPRAASPASATSAQLLPTCRLTVAAEGLTGAASAHPWAVGHCTMMINAA